MGAKTYIRANKRPEIIGWLVERDGWVCWLCGHPIKPDLPRGSRAAASIDHVIPRSRGGTNRMDNLRLAHHCCNRARGDRRAA